MPEHSSTGTRHRSPHPLLAGLVERYVGYRFVTGGGVHRGLPSPTATFIVALDEGVHVAAQTDTTQAPARYDTLVGGLHRRPALIAYGPVQEGIQIDLTPLGVRTLLGLPLAALWNLTVDLTDIDRLFADQLASRLRDCDGWDRRFALLDEMLVRRRGEPRVALIDRAWQLALAGGRVDAVAREVGLSRQHLTRRFRSELGVTPRLAARLARFDLARRLDAPNLATRAAQAGYADQAHFAREVAAFAECTPGQLFADPLLAADAA